MRNRRCEDGDRKHKRIIITGNYCNAAIFLYFINRNESFLIQIISYLKTGSKLNNLVIDEVIRIKQLHEM